MDAKETALDIYNTHLALIKDHTRGVSIHTLAKASASFSVDLLIHDNIGREEDCEWYEQVKQEIQKL